MILCIRVVSKFVTKKYIQLCWDSLSWLPMPINTPHMYNLLFDVIYTPDRNN